MEERVNCVKFISAHAGLLILWREGRLLGDPAEDSEGHSIQMPESMWTNQPRYQFDPDSLRTFAWYSKPVQMVPGDKLHLSTFFFSTKPRLWSIWDWMTDNVNYIAALNTLESESSSRLIDKISRLMLSKIWWNILQQIQFFSEQKYPYI